MEIVPDEIDFVKTFSIVLFNFLQISILFEELRGCVWGHMEDLLTDK